MGRPLSELLGSLDLLGSQGDLGRRIQRITHDSRHASPGTLFVAYRGVNQDVHRYVPDALSRGASAVLVERPIAELRAELNIDADAVLVEVPDAREARALIACALYDHPSREMRVIGVTGTDGKTTTATWIHAILGAAGHRAGLVTTVAARIGEQSLDTGLHVTTPEPEDLQAYLRAMREQGADVAVLEVTSHGLHQHRVTGIDFDIAVLTNVTDEALEYHGGFEAYRDTKALLFAMLRWVEEENEGFTPAAVLNLDDPSHAHFRTAPGVARLTYSLDPESVADYRAERIEEGRAGLRFALRTSVGEQPDARAMTFDAPLTGRYNVSNALAAIAAARALGVDLEACRAGISSVSGIPGRMERIDAGQDFLAIVDFAHTANGLRSALRAAVALRGPEGRLIAVFGCAGLRDAGKRPVMGAIAAELADLSILTAEDPRTEPLDAILDAMTAGMRQAGAREGRDFVLEPDRGKAILRACEDAGPGDVVIVCGKGHEQSMCFGTTEYPWDDRAAMRSALAGEALGGLPTATGRRE